MMLVILVLHKVHYICSWFYTSVGMCSTERTEPTEVCRRDMTLAWIYNNTLNIIQLNVSVKNARYIEEQNACSNNCSGDSSLPGGGKLHSRIHKRINGDIHRIGRQVSRSIGKYLQCQTFPSLLKKKRLNSQKISKIYFVCVQ